MLGALASEPDHLAHEWRQTAGMMSISGAGFSPARSGDLSHLAEARNQAIRSRVPLDQQ